ncbi:WXG100 family type VII secretion target [Dactylosporangium sp. CS-047395]|uniref:WXG100 family type VII secretion target n=1 Tax=Dactylosporangium sp. CS-047395 TaxID=3239936 RepID=UPI003D8E3CDF
MVKTVELSAVTVDDIWELAARPELLGRAATTWRAVRADVRAALDALEQAAGPITRGSWEGEAAEGFRRHFARYTECLHDLDAVLLDTSVALDGAAALLRNGRDQLDAAFGYASGVPHRRGDGTVTFAPVDAAQEAAVRAAITEALDIRAESGARAGRAARAAGRRAGPLGVARGRVGHGHRTDAAGLGAAATGRRD